MIYAAGVIVAPIAYAAADKAAHASTYVGIGAGVCAIITAIGLPTWRAFRTAKQERAHQTDMLTRVHAGMFGKQEVVENGVTVERKEDGLIDRVASLEAQFQEGSVPLLDLKATLDRNHTENSQRLDSHEREIAEARVVAGAAAAEAAAARDRIEFLAGRWWERVEGIEQSNRFLRSVATEHGYDVGHPEVTDGPADVHDPGSSAD